jgi:UDP-N-acetylmuramate dehydrogenase
VLAAVTDRCGADVAATMPCYPAGEGFKLSAAWLIDRAGFARGWQVPADDGGTGRAGLSTKHTLALTNRGGATTADIVALATAVRDGVRAAFGVTLVPEPVWVGVSLPD